MRGCPHADALFAIFCISLALLLSPSKWVSCSETCESRMIRSCSRSIGRHVAVATQTRTIVCARSLVGRPVAAEASSAARFPARFDVALRRGLSTLTDEELRRKMDDFNDLFVTVSALNALFLLLVSR